MPTARARPPLFETEQTRQLARQLVGRLMDGACGCCGRPNPLRSVWCAACETHVSTTGRLCERTFQQVHGTVCPLAVDGQTGP